MLEDSKSSRLSAIIVKDDGLLDTTSLRVSDSISKCHALMLLFIHCDLSMLEH